MSLALICVGAALIFTSTYALSGLRSLEAPPLAAIGAALVVLGAFYNRIAGRIRAGKVELPVASPDEGEERQPR